MHREKCYICCLADDEILPEGPLLRRRMSNLEGRSIREAETSLESNDVSRVDAVNIPDRKTFRREAVGQAIAL
jgi:hypothetical protein